MATNNLTANKDTGMEPILGILRARVEDNRDPLRLGRVRIRIPSMHGIPTQPNNTNNPAEKVDENSTTQHTNIGVPIDKDRDTAIQRQQCIETDGLPWAYPVSMSGGGAGHGGLIVPSVGDYVFVSFENGDRNSPIYFGGCFGIPSSPKYYGSTTPSDHSNDKSNDNGLNYKSGVGISEAPNVYDQNGDPTIQILYSSQNGSSISVNDSKGSEQLTLSDRSQQVISLVHPSSTTENKVLIASGPSQSISVVGKSKDTPHINISSGLIYKPEELSSLTLNSTQTELVVGTTARVTVRGTTVQVLLGDSTSVTLVDGTATIKASNISLDGDVSISGNLSISGNVHGSGDIIASGKNSNHHHH